MTGAAPSRGLHPAIDAWYDACDTTMPVTERQRLAAVVEAAPDAASFIMLLSHADSRLLNEDAKTHRQRLKELSQQRSLGRDIG